MQMSSDTLFLREYAACLEPDLASVHFRLNVLLAIKINNDPWQAFTGWKLLGQFYPVLREKI